MLRKGKQVQWFLLPREYFARANRRLSKQHAVPNFGGNGGCGTDSHQLQLQDPKQSMPHIWQLHGAMCNLSKEFLSSSPLAHPVSISVTDLWGYRHGIKWSEVQQIYTVAGGRKTPCLWNGNTFKVYWSSTSPKKAIRAILLSLHSNNSKWF